MSDTYDILYIKQIFISTNVLFILLSITNLLFSKGNLLKALNFFTCLLQYDYVKQVKLYVYV